MYTRAWDETQPPGTALAATLDTIIQNFKTDTRERVAGIFGLNLAEFSADPIVPKSLTLSGALVAASLAGPLTGNVTGNLTGSVLTPAQTNITSVGTLIGLTVGGNTTLAADANQILFKSTSGSAYVQFIGAAASGHLNWQIGKSVTVANSLEFTPSTAADGSTYTTPAAKLTAAGVLSAVSFTGTLNTAAQPNVTSVGTLTGLAVVGAGNSAQISTTSNAGAIYLSITLDSAGTPKTTIVGADPSTGGSGFIGTITNHSFVIRTNNTARQTIDAAGNVVFTGTVTAANFVGPTSIDAANLTGTTMAASVIHSSLQDVGTLTALGVSGIVTFGSGFSAPAITQALFGSSSVVGSIGTAQSSGHVSIAYNARQTGANGSGTDSWTQSLAGLGSSLVQVTPASFEFYTAPAGQGVANMATFWTSRASITTAGFVGNLTGTILTAAQANITSLGTLTALAVSAAPAFTVARTSGTNSVALTFADNVTGAQTIGFGTRLLGTSNSGSVASAIGFESGGTGTNNESQLGFYTQNSAGTLTRQMTIASTGQILFGTTSLAGVAAGGIHVAGTSVFDDTINSVKDGLILSRNAASTGVQYGQFINTTGGIAWGVESSAGGVLVAGSTGYDAVIRGKTGISFSANDGTNLHFRIASTGAITANGAWTFNSTIAGVTTLTATTINGTLATASQTNITAVGTLGNLTVSGTITGNVTGNLTGTILTAAQGNITSVGTLTALTVSGNLTMTAAASQLIPGVTSFAIRNNANSQNNFLFANGGKFSLIGDGGAGISIDLLNSGKYAVNGTQVVGLRVTGWAASTAGQSRTAIAAADTLATTISHLAALKEDLQSHGLIGA